MTSWQVESPSASRGCQGSCSALRVLRSTRLKTSHLAPRRNWPIRSAYSPRRWCASPPLSTATGFAELRQLFRTQLRARTLTYRERIERLQSRTPKATSPGAVFRAQAGQAIAELQSFQHAIDDRLLTQAVELIATASQINLLAARRSFPVAAYLAYALNQLEVRTQLLDNVGGMNREFAARIDADEVIIAISFRNYTDEIVDIADSCRKRGAAVIAITDSKLSPLMRVATLSFAIGDDGGAAFRSLVEPIVLAQSLVVAVGHRLMVERANRRATSQVSEQEAPQKEVALMKDGATPRALDVICIGRAAVDLYGEQIGARLEDVTTFARYLGGSPANTAVGCARLGLRAAMLTRVGDEQNGRFVLDSLAREGVDVSHVRLDPQRLTALVFLSIRSRTAFPLLFYRDHCADMALEATDVDPRFIASSTHRCCSQAPTCRSRKPMPHAEQRSKPRAQRAAASFSISTFDRCSGGSRRWATEKRVTCRRPVSAPACRPSSPRAI